MKTAIIIDDEPLARSIITEYLLAFPEIEIVQQCENGFEGLKAIKELHPDLVFLDIQMPKINGFEMLELLEQKPAIIFTTAFEEYAIKAFEAHAIDYLLKPFDESRFARSMEKFFQQTLPGTESLDILVKDGSGFPNQSERIVVKTGNKIKIIPVHDIIYLEADDDYVKIHTPEGAFLKNKTMAFFEKSLPRKDFVRVHRSYIVKVSQITRIEPYDKEGHLLLLKSGAKVCVSKNGYPRLKEVLGI